MKLIRPNDTYSEGFGVLNSSNAAANADSLPTASLYRNGTVDGAVTVTVTNITTGAYKFSCTIPSGYAAGDLIYFLVTVVIGGVTQRGFTEPFTVAASDAAGHLRVTIKDGTGQGEILTTSGAIDLLGAGADLYGESGSVAFTYTVYDTDGATPLPGVAVWVSADIAGIQRSQTKITDALGRVSFDLDPSTVYFWRSYPSRTFPNPDTEVVS